MSYLSDLLGDAFKEGMTEEEISEALKAKQEETDAQNQALLSKKDAEIANLKTTIQKSNSEAAKYKKELNSFKSEDERKKEEQESELNSLRETVASLEKEKKVSGFVASYLKLGYPEELAVDTANAMVDGDTEKVFANQKAFNEQLENSVKANLTKNVPAPTGGQGGKTYTREDIRKMSHKEVLALYESNPEAYRAAYEN